MIYNLVTRLSSIILLILGLFVSTAKASPMETGDAYFIKMDYKQAIAVYEQVANATNAELQWHLARAYICLSDVSSQEDRKVLVEKAEAAARKCISLNEKLSAGHSWLAAALGNRAIYEGSKGKVHLCNEIKKELDRAIELNPNDDIAYSILGSFYKVLGKVNWMERTMAKAFLGGLPAGGYTEGEQALKKAIAIAPNTIRHWHELATIYEAWGRPEDAHNAYVKAVQLKPQVLSDNERLQLCRSKIN